MGRITQNLEIRQTTNGTPCLSFTVAVDRNFKNSNGEYDTDFISCVAWRDVCEFIVKWFSKGRMIALEGNLRTRTYEDKNGTKHYLTEVFVDSASFTGEKKEEQKSYIPQPQAQQSAQQNVFSDDGFEKVFSDGDVPF
jgi:single-strand DNA-binding protein